MSQYTELITKSYVWIPVGWVALVVTVGLIRKYLWSTPPKTRPPLDMKDINQSINDIFDRPHNRVSLAADIPRLSRKISFTKTTNGETITLPAIEDGIKSIEQLFREIALYCSKSTDFTDALMSSLAAEYGKNSDLNLTTRCFLEDQTPQLEQHKCFNLLRCASQDALAPAVIQLKKACWEITQFKDVRGFWYIEYQLEETQSKVIHRRREQSPDPNKHFEFEWLFTIKLDQQMKLVAASIEVLHITFANNYPATEKEALMNVLSPYLTMPVN